ncbi:MAG: HlyD family efflux transporter periplasmic adaptor subunit [Treponema sp.]|nr:HlyD family efflux transporter periplasmic adaptor subunit [Treponema sp.]
MEKKKLIKFSIIIVTSVAVIVAGLLIARKLISKSKISNTVYAVKKEVYENSIEVAGVVSAAHEQTLQALSAGTVVSVNVKQGDTVKKGDLIIQLDDTEQQYNLAKHDYEMETVRISGSSRELLLKQTQRLSLVQKISDRKVTATFDGIIADIDVAVGDSLEAKDSVGTLVDVSYLIADVEVAETDVAKLKAGQKVDFTFPSYNGTVEGSVVGWPAIGEVTSRGATVVKVRLRIDSPYPDVILPNFSFSGKIQISPPEEYLLVERYAVARDGQQAYVQKVRGGERVNVTVVPYDREYVKITEGNISEGDILKAQSEAGASGSKRGSRGGMPSGSNRGGGGFPPPGGF